MVNIRKYARIRGFYDNGMNGYTGTKYDEKGYDINGLHKDTDTEYNVSGHNLFGFKVNGSRHRRHGQVVTTTEKGFDMQGIHEETGTEYDKDGRDIFGVHVTGMYKSGYDISGAHINGKRSIIEKYIYDENGYDAQGFNIEGLDSKGFGRKGFNKEGVHKDTNELYNLEGYDINGRDKDGYDINGKDPNGFDRRGFKEGIHKVTRTNRDENGFDLEGFDEKGNHIKGFDARGIHIVTKSRYGPDGRDIDGYNRAGFNELGYNIKTRTKYDPTGHNMYGFSKLGIHKETNAKYDKEGFDVKGRGINGYNREGILVDVQQNKDFKARVRLIQTIANESFTFEQYKNKGIKIKLATLIKFVQNFGEVDSSLKGMDEQLKRVRLKWQEEGYWETRNGIPINYIDKNEPKKSVNLAEKKTVESNEAKLNTIFDTLKEVGFLQLNYEILPNGKVDTLKLPPDFAKILNEIENSANAKDREYLQTLSPLRRLKFLIELKPQDIYIGTEKFEGYLMFQYKTQVIVEKFYEEVDKKPSYGNATYIFPKDSSIELSKLSRTEIIAKMDVMLEVRRVTHTGKWHDRIIGILNINEQNKENKTSPRQQAENQIKNAIDEKEELQSKISEKEKEIEGLKEKLKDLEEQNPRNKDTQEEIES